MIVTKIRELTLDIRILSVEITVVYHTRLLKFTLLEELLGLRNLMLSHRFCSLGQTNQQLLWGASIC